MKKINYFSLGATLYTPCTHARLSEIMQHGLGSKSMVFCTEDAVAEYDLQESLANLRLALSNTDDVSFYRFVRPRNSDIFSEILSFEGIDKIEGFVLPKYDLKTADDYHQVITSHPDVMVMPTLESSDILDPSNLSKIRKKLDKIKDNVICLRIGGNDLFNLLGLKRMQYQTIYESPLRAVIEQIVIAFRPYGYEISAPVFDFINDIETLKSELYMDLNFGLFCKTAIHPRQVEIIESFYQEYSSVYIKQAESILSEQSSAVYQLNGQMMEKSCHFNWAQRTKNLASSF
ncbi:HpcH/HpaI aldolase/citrate lyase family protein [Enterovibrio makurazakiensis]|uniref:HpcH/HpaI aldolase/citrate lyase family protein n=1 Tax=Enterovibrio makurazakiensis TaxID=2910232 RepID=UPI003D2447C6